MVASFTLFGAPTARVFQKSSAEIWHTLYMRGMSLMPKVAAVVAASYAYAAWDARRRDESWGGFLSAAGLVLSIIPFTIIVMSSTNKELMSSAQGSLVLTQSQTMDLIKKWEVLNAVRSLLPLLGAVTGLFTFLGNRV